FFLLIVLPVAVAVGRSVFALLGVAIGVGLGVPVGGSAAVGVLLVVTGLVVGVTPAVLVFLLAELFRKPLDQRRITLEEAFAERIARLARCARAAIGNDKRWA